MSLLTDSQARRGGATASRWYETVDRIRADAASAAIRLKFSIGGNNNGTTEVEVDVGPKDFPTLLEIMCNVDRQAAMQAMTVELARQVQTQPERDKTTATSARSELTSLAYRKFSDAPYGKDDSERAIWLGVQELDKEISQKK